jgi:hypothetical protein
MQGRGNNVCTEEFESLLAEEGDWLRNEIVLGAENTCTAVTVHLVQHDNSFTSMFTHRGVLAGFHCNQIPRVHEILRDGGVMYVSGIFKTYLWNDLALNLRRLKRLPGKTLVCVDHGRLIVKEEASESKEPEVDSAAVKAVCNVFKQDLVDVYFCTYGELLDFYRIAEDFYPENRQNVEQTLAELASRHKLPFITIVRYRDDQGEARAYAIVGGQTNSQEGEPVQYVLQDCIGPINAFNAVFMHRLIRGCNEFSLLELVDAAVRAGLEGWQRAARHSHAVVHN